MAVDLWMAVAGAAACLVAGVFIGRRAAAWDRKEKCGPSSRIAGPGMPPEECEALDEEELRLRRWM